MYWLKISSKLMNILIQISLSLIALLFLGKAIYLTLLKEPAYNEFIIGILLCIYLNVRSKD